MNNRKVIIDDYFVKKYALPTNIAKAEHLKDIVEEDKSHELKLAPKFQEEYLNTNNHFQKMRVGVSKRTFSEEVSLGLEFLAAKNPTDERLTTTFFIDFVSKWFHIMCGRTLNVALSNKNIEKYAETIAFLEEAIRFFTSLKVGHDRKWKPFQTAMLISTKTVIDLGQHLLENGFTFFMPARLTQDCLENLFSVMRLKNVVPNGFQFKNNLKLICISQFMKVVSSSNYDTDDREFLGEFLDVLLKNRSTNSHYVADESSLVEPVIAQECINLNKTEENVLYYIAGYIIQSIQKNQKVCDVCVNSTKSSTNMYKSYNILTHLKANKKKRYFFVNMETFEFFLQMERIFRMYYKNVTSQKINVKNFL